MTQPDPCLNDDLDQLSREQLAGEVRRLHQTIRRHRDSSGHNLCSPPTCGRCCRSGSGWLLPSPAWPKFMHGRIRYRQSLDRQLPDTPRSDEPYAGTTPDG